MPQASYAVAFLLSVGIAVWPWLFPFENRSYYFFDLVVTFIGVFSGLLSIAALAKKISVPRNVGYGACFLLLCIVLLIGVARFWDKTIPPAPAVAPGGTAAIERATTIINQNFIIPAPAQMEHPLLEHNKEHNHLSEQNNRAVSPPQNVDEWRFVANALSSQTWTDGKAYTVYAEGRFDFSEAQWMRIVFEPSQAGTQFLLRLVPMGANPDKQIGLRWELVEIPADGIVLLPLKAAEFGFTPAEMRQLEQVAILSGDNAWNKPLGQDASKRAIFEKIEIR